MPPVTVQARTISRESLRATRDLIQRIYRNYAWPLIVQVSTGKDSTAACQLVCEAIELLPVGERRDPIHVVIGDVGGSETPQVRERIDLTARLLGEYVAGNQIPLTAHVVTPIIADQLLVCIVGRGYASATSGFRWCTERAKILPGRRIIRALTGTHGQAIQILGVRSSESAARAGSITRHTITNSPLRRTSTARLWGLHPIESWSTADVWWYLSTFPSPWGGWHYNQTLAQLYKSASTEKECPVVLDTSGPGCGASRFACWHCTVPSFNHSLAAMIEDEQHAWAWPLLEIWEFLRLTVDPTHKLVYREPRLRADGSIHIKRDGSAPIPGKYTLAVRLLLLEMILRAQRDMRIEGPDPQITLLDTDEIRAIRVFWRQHPEYPTDGNDPAREITHRYTGVDIGPYQEADQLLLERPQATRAHSASTQEVLDLFGLEEGAAS